MCFGVENRIKLVQSPSTALSLNSTVVIGASGKSGDFLSNPDTKNYLWVDSSNNNAQDKQNYIKVSSTNIWQISSSRFWCYSLQADGASMSQ